MQNAQLTPSAEFQLPLFDLSSLWPGRFTLASHILLCCPRCRQQSFTETYGTEEVRADHGMRVRFVGQVRCLRCGFHCASSWDDDTLDLLDFWEG
jgi:hypothetical protein